MTKGVFIMKTLVEKNRLKEICDSLKIGYQNCLSIANGEKTPSLNLMKKLRFLIPLDFWVDEVTTEFQSKLKNVG